MLFLVIFITLLLSLYLPETQQTSSMQWRANCSQSQGLGYDEVGKANWGWSWKERWIAARPWESRVAPQFISPKKVQGKQANKVGKTPKTPISVKTPSSNGKQKTSSNGKQNTSSNGKQTIKARRLSFPSSEKLVPSEESVKVEETNIKKEELVS